jgi:hypothetical protein
MMMLRSSATLALLLATASSFQIPCKQKATFGARNQIIKTIAFGYLDGLAGEKSQGSESKSTKPVTAKKEKGAGPKFKPVEDDASSDFLAGLKMNAKSVTAEENPTTKSYTPEIVKSIPMSENGAKSSVVGLESVPDIVKSAPASVPVFSLGGPRDTPPPPLSSRKPVTKPGLSL